MYTARSRTKTWHRFIIFTLALMLIIGTLPANLIYAAEGDETPSTGSNAGLKWLTYKFDLNDFSDPAQQALFQLNGNAAFANGRLIVNPSTPANKHVAGSGFNKQSFQPHQDFSFSTGFSFVFNTTTGTNTADGMTFAIVNDLEGLGSTGGGMGIGGVVPSFALKFDTYRNGEAINDPSNNYIGIAINGNINNTNSSWYKDLNAVDLRDGSGRPKFVLGNGKTYYTWLDYNGSSNNLKVYFNDSASKPSDPIIDANEVELKEIFQDTDAIYTGFTGVGYNETHEILSWYFVNDFAPIGSLDDTSGYQQAPSSIDMDVQGTSEAGKYKITVTAKNANETLAVGVPIEVTSSKSGVWTDASGAIITDWSTMLTNAEGLLEVYFEPYEPFTTTDIRAVAVGGAIATGDAPAMPTAPGGVSDGLISWVDVGKSAIKDSENRVVKLQDLSDVRTWGATNTVGQPYKASTINFNPGVTIDSSSGYYSTSIFETNNLEREIFSVQIRDHYQRSDAFPWEFGSNYDRAKYGANNGSQIITSAFSTSSRTVNINTSEYDLLKSRVLNIRSSNEEWSLSLDGRQLLASTENQVKIQFGSLGSYYIGAGHYSRFDGSISEVILFNRVLTDNERQRVNSYMALKYGLTLATDYLDSGTGTMWTTEDSANYGNRITGIGRDNNGALYQKQSVSQEVGANVTIALGDSVENSNEENPNTIWNDKSYIVFGDNGGKAGFVAPAEKEDESLKRIERVYKLKKTNWQDTNAVTGEASTITLQVDKVNGASDWPLYVVVSADEQFDANDSFYLIEDGKVTIETKDLNSVSFFTIAAQVPQFVSAVLEKTETGDARIVITFDRKIELNDLAGFTVTIEGNEVAAEFEVDPTDNTKLILKLPTGIDLIGKDVNVDYDGTQNLRGTNGVPVDRFNKPVENNLVDKTLLKAKADEIDEAIEAGELKGADYTADSWQALEEALTEAKKVLADEDATQEQVNEALAALEKAHKELVEVEEPTVPAVDKTALQAKADEIDKAITEGELKGADYTADSWKALQDAQAAAKAVLADANANQAEVDSALAALNEARAKLVKAPTSPGNGGGTVPTPAPTPTPTPESPIISTADGSKVPFASASTVQTGDSSQITIKVERDKLSELLNEGKGQKLGIQVPGSGDVDVQGLTVEDLKKLIDTGSSLDIEDLLAIYPVPADQLKLDEIVSQFGNTPLSEIAVNIKIKRSSEALANLATEQVAAKGYELLVHPVEIDLTFTHNGQTNQADLLAGYAVKYIALPEGIDPNRITTGVVIKPDGTVLHVPTVVTKFNNRYFALINDLRSYGTYSVIWNPRDLNDVKTHWAKDSVNNMAARLVIEGTGNNNFTPDRVITRSEFAVFIVRGLGLMHLDVEQNKFHDVSTAIWFHDAVTIANDFGIVLGYNDGAFRGDLEITREQGMAMIYRSFQLINPEASMSEDQINSVLSTYDDAHKIAPWAKEAIAMLISQGITEGKNEQLLDPKGEMTRAEAAALIQRLLKATQLID